MAQRWLATPLLLGVALSARASLDGTIAATTNMHAERAAHTATALRDGRVLIAGGFTQASSPHSAEVYEPASKRFTLVTPMRTARHSHTATLLANGKVLIAGGFGEGTTTLTSAELFDPTSNTFTPTGSMRTPRESHVAVRLGDGTVLVVGGHRGRRETMEVYASAEIFRPTTGTFERVSDMRVRRHKHDAIVLAAGACS